MQQKTFPHFTLFAIALAASFQLALADTAEFDFLSFAALEGFHSDKQWCEKNYPEFRSKNEVIFSKSIYAKMTGEEFIQTYASSDLKQRFLAALPKMRSDKQEEYTHMPRSFLQQMCSAFDRHLGKESTQEAKTQPRPPASK